MIPTLRYAGERVVVMGLGKSGQSAAESLRASGADVRVWDDQAAQLASATARGFSAFDGDNPDFDNVRGARVEPRRTAHIPQTSCHSRACACSRHAACLRCGSAFGNRKRTPQ